MFYILSHTSHSSYPHFLSSKNKKGRLQITIHIPSRLYTNLLCCQMEQFYRWWSILHPILQWKILQQNQTTRLRRLPQTIYIWNIGVLLRFFSVSTPYIKVTLDGRRFCRVLRYNKFIVFIFLLITLLIIPLILQQPELCAKYSKSTSTLSSTSIIDYLLCNRIE